MHGRRARQSERGFTLIEVVVTSAMALIVFASMFGAMLAQQRSYEVQLDSSEASQNARAGLAIIKNELRMAGWGLEASTRASFPAIGTCNNSSNRFDCNDLPTFGDATSTSDRIRLVSMRTAAHDRAANWSSGALSTFNTGTYAPDDAPAFEIGSYVIIDGWCSSFTIPRPYAAVAEISTRSLGTGYHHLYTVANPPTATGYPLLGGCTSLDSTVRAGAARIVDFYIDRTLDTPRLMMNVNPDGSVDASGVPNGAEVVAYGVDSLQIEYGLDLGSNLAVSPTDIPNQQVDIWCDDLVSCDLTPVTSTTFTPAERAARTVAVRIGIVTRADSSVYSADSPGPSFAAFDATVAGDEHRRWLFRGTVRLRNNEL